MRSDFRIIALRRAEVEAWFGLSDAELWARGARRVMADASPGYPCRVSLDDAKVGETLLLLPYAHHDVSSPYAASGPIFVREAASDTVVPVNEVPLSIARRLLSVRAYDAAGMMQDAEVVEGTAITPVIDRFFADPVIAYLHVHNAKPGCFACRVERAAPA